MRHFKLFHRVYERCLAVRQFLVGQPQLFLRLLAHGDVHNNTVEERLPFAIGLHRGGNEAQNFPPFKAVEFYFYVFHEAEAQDLLAELQAPGGST